MAFFNTSFHSDSLGMACSMNVIVPQRVSSQIGMKSSGGRKQYPVLYLLHGMSDDHSVWSRRTSIERYVADMDLVVIMPGAARSFYTDLATGAKYWTFISEELPKIVAEFFPISTKREDTFVAGLSMGGYGALKLALRCPDRYAAGAGISSVTDMAGFLNRLDSGNRSPEADGFFGPDRKVPDDCDLTKLAIKTAQLPEQERPKIMQICGTEDFLYQENIVFRDLIQSLNAYDYSYDEGPGTHTWEFWDKRIQQILKWLPIRNF